MPLKSPEVFTKLTILHTQGRQSFPNAFTFAKVKAVSVLRKHVMESQAGMGAVCLFE